MKLAHLADLHLGRRQFDRSAPGGMNAREKDVQDAVTRAVDDILVVRPDVVLIAGDVFDTPRPPNASVLFLAQQLQRLQGTPVAIIAGNHDSPRSIDTASILPLYRQLGAHVITRDVERIGLLGCVVTCVPSSAVKQPFAPNPDAPLNVLLLHAAVQGCGYGEDVSDEQMRPWDYVALGDFHIAHQVGPRAWYSGSIEFTSTDPWSECHQPKGYLLVDLAPGAEPVVEFRPIACRRFLDLTVVDAVGLTPADLDAALATALGAVDLTDAVARLVVLNVPRDVERAVDWKALRTFKACAFHLQVDFRRPEAQANTAVARAIRMRRLDQIVDEFLSARALPADVDRDALRRRGQEYLEDAKHAADPYQERQSA